MPVIRTSRDLVNEPGNTKQPPPRRTQRIPVPRLLGQESTQPILQQDQFVPSLEERLSESHPSPATSFTVLRQSANVPTPLERNITPTKISSIATSRRKPHQTIRKSIIIKGQKLEPTIVFDTFWRFAAERKAIDDRRRSGIPGP